MTQYTDVFGNSAVPPSEYGYQAIVITTDTTAQWPYNYSGTETVISKIMDFTCSAGNAFTLPAANQVSTGEDFLIRNVGSNTLTVKDAGGSTISTVAAGSATYFYVTSNTTAAGVYGQIAYGVGSAAISAGALVGYGLQAQGATLNVAFSVSTTSSLSTIVAGDLASMISYSGGSGTLALTAVATLGNAFWFMFANNGTGTVTIDPAGVETIDGSASKTVQPGESLMVFCSGTAWFTVGYGRSTTYQFTQLTLDVSAAGTFTLTSAQAANKLLTFTGNPASAVTVVVPNTVSIYYVQSSISTAQTITVKTAAGTGGAVAQTQRAILICDGTNVSSAQSATVTSALSMLDGTVSAPALNFASQTNTGFYKYSTTGLGISVNGVSGLVVDPTAGLLFNTNKFTVAYATGNTVVAGTFQASGHVTLEGVTSTGATGTGKLVFDTSPTLVTPILGAATATTINKVTVTQPATGATLTIPDGVTLTGPAASGTAMTLGNTETVTGVKTFGSAGAVGRFKLAGTTSGSTVLDASAVASGTLTLPAATDTVAVLAASQAFTNKTYNGNTWTAGTGTLTLGAGKTFTASNTLTLAGTDGTTITFQGTDTYTGRATTDTLTNKRVTQRVTALSANSATPTINTDNCDVVHITSQTAAITSFTTNLTGTPVDGDKLRISITGTGAVALTWGASFESSTATLPTTTVSTTRLDVGFFWNTETSKWRCVAVA